MKHLCLIAALFSSFASAQETSDRWQFSFTPYLWLAGVKGSTAAGGSEPPDLDPDYNFFALDNLEAVMFLNFAMSKNRWTLETDALYINFADNFDVGPVNTNIDLKGSAIELSVGYKPAGWDYAEVIFGARRLQIDIDIELTPGLDGADGQAWVDPIVGMRYIRPVSNRWDAILRADVGGFGVSSDFTFNAFAAARYRFGDTFSMLFGFRHLAFDFKEDDFIADLQIDGFLVGFNFIF